MQSKKHIYLIDDHPVFREGLKLILSRSAYYDVVGEAGSGAAALKNMEQVNPDLALVDISLPDCNGFELIHDIVASLSRTKVLVISMHSKTDYIIRAFQLGAKGYLLKESAADTLLQGIDSVFKGEYFMDSRVSQQVIKKMAGLNQKKVTAAEKIYDTLTHREQEVMALLAKGLTSADVAEKLFISTKTVENHRANIMRKLDLHSVFDLIRYSAKIGLIDVDLWKE